MLILKESEKFLTLAQAGLPVVDVRSPSEYKQAHIPSALSYPLFSDEERAQIGTVYKKQGRQEAVLLGLALVDGRLRIMAEFGLQHAVLHNGKKTILLHCWRGGMRSASVAWLFEQAGITCYVLDGGYKKYRADVLSILNTPLRLKVLGGKTGSGKTEILKELQKRGEQIIDLEDLASHKGSAFGFLGQCEQPTQEQFENNLAEQLRKLDMSRYIWIEDESRMIGKIALPQNLWQSKLSSMLYFVNSPLQTRVQRLLEDYGKFSLQDLQAALSKIEKRLGGERSKAAQNALVSGNIEEAIELALYYYDKAYLHATGKRNANIVTIEFCGISQTVEALLKNTSN